MVHYGVALILALLITTVAPAQISATLRPQKDAANNLQQGLISCWEFDEGTGGAAFDEKGLNTFTTVGTWQPGVTGTCITFNGVNEGAYTLSTNDYNYDADTYSYSVNFWYNSTSPNPSGHPNNYLLYYRTGAVGEDYPFAVVYVPGVNMQFYIYNGVTTYVATVSEVDYTWNDGQWHMWTMIRDKPNESISIYLDGELVADQAATIVNYESTYAAQLRVGYAGPAGRHTRMKFDQLAIWGERALSQDDIDYLFNGGLGLPYANWQ